jgi:hypothetical protein
MHHHRAVVGAGHADLVKVAGPVGSDQHRDPFVEVFDEDWIVEGVEDGLIAHPVLAGAVEDPWLRHKLPWAKSDRKVTWHTFVDGATPGLKELNTAMLGTPTEIPAQETDCNPVVSHWTSDLRPLIVVSAVGDEPAMGAVR